MSSRRLSGEIIDLDSEPLSASKRLLRNVSQRLKRKNDNKDSEGNVAMTSGWSFRCLTLYSRGGHCKVGADTGEEFGDSGSRRQPSASQEGQGYATMYPNEGVSMSCFSSYGIKKKLWRRTSRHILKSHETQKCSSLNLHLPDDILEMCLVRLPLTSLMNARLVCKKWRSLTTTPRFLQMRRDGSFQTPWLFLFGIVKDGSCSREVHAFDVSQNQWHQIDSGILKGRSSFSVACIQDNIYIVGGCSSFGRADQSSCKIHKGVLVFNPLTKSWRKAAPMNCARLSPVLGILEQNPDCLIIRNQLNRPGMHFYSSQAGGSSDVYQDPHRLSIKRQSRHCAGENGSPVYNNIVKPYICKRQKNQGLYQCVIIAVGGLGSWNEPLDSGEIYDPMSNKWTEIQRLPPDFGIACSGVVCNGMFYVYSDSDNLAGYDIEKGYWIRLQTSPCLPRVHEYHPKLVSCKGRLLMLCVSWCEGDGQIGRRNKAVRKLWELDLMHLTWNEVSVHPDAPMDWYAAFVADEDLVFGVEMFKIFGQVLDFVTMFNVSDPGKSWTHISRNYVGRSMDAASCLTKSVAVLCL